MANGSKWTVMVYLAGNNNLSEECVWSLKEMTKAFEAGTQTDNSAKQSSQKEINYEGSDERITVFAQFDSPISNEQQPRIKIVRRQSTVEGEGIVPYLNDPAKVRGMSYQELLDDFIFNSIELDKQRSADYHMVILSGHGSGTEGDFLTSGNPSRALTIPELGATFSKVQKKLKKKINILGMDSCLMSMVEVSYQLRNYVDILVGAEGFALNTGWPYREILTVLRTEDRVPKEMAKRVVNEYIKYYKDYTVAGMSVDLAACKLEGCDALAKVVGRLAELLRKKLVRDSRVKNAVLLAHWKAQSYKDDQYTDLYDFCDVLQDKLNELGYGRHRPQEAAIKKSDLWRACDDVKNAVKGMVLLSCYSGGEVQYSNGLSIYFPWSEVAKDYKKLEFAKATAQENSQANEPDVETGWFGFLKCYVNATRRDPRPGLGKKPVTGSSIIESSPSDHRFDPPYNKFDPPYNKMVNSRLSSMKNPPIAYFECNCRDVTNEPKG